VDIAANATYLMLYNWRFSIVLHVAIVLYWLLYYHVPRQWYIIEITHVFWLILIEHTPKHCFQSHPQPQKNFICTFELPQCPPESYKCRNRLMFFFNVKVCLNHVIFIFILLFFSHWPGFFFFINNCIFYWERNQSYSNNFNWTVWISLTHSLYTISFHLTL